MNPLTRQCRGCLRTVEEIASWYDASPAEKRRVLAVLEARRASLGNSNG
jgi:uncharacterized protein